MDDRTEHLITRRLDGEITEDESLELDKQLIRSPEARGCLAEQERIDALAGQTLRAILAPDASQPVPQAESAGWPGQANRWWRYLRPVAAVAAAVTLAVLVGTLPISRSRPDKAPAPLADNSPGAGGQSTSQVPVIPANSGWSNLPQAGQHKLLGVFDDETQSLYLLEMNRRSSASPSAVMDF